MQAAEAIKLLVGFGEPLTGRLLTLDARSMAVMTLAIKRQPDCAVCGGRHALAGAAGAQPTRKRPLCLQQIHRPMACNA